MYVLYDPEDETYYTASGYWVQGRETALTFTNENISEALWLAGYFNARIMLVYTDGCMRDVTKEF